MRISREKTGGNWLPERGGRNVWKIHKNQRFGKERARSTNTGLAYFKILPRIIWLYHPKKGEKIQDLLWNSLGKKQSQGQKI